METKEKDIETFYPTSRNEWRNWLAEYHDKKQSIWVIQFKKECDIPTLTWSEAVDEAICFGWIDSTRRSIDHQKYMQFFTRRKPKSGWSKINKEKVLLLQEQQLMSKAGLDVVEKAKQNGSWSILDHIEELQIPEDLEKAFETLPVTKTYYLSLSKSARKSILHWLSQAKKTETRQKRINEIVEHAAIGKKLKLF